MMPADRRQNAVAGDGIADDEYFDFRVFVAVKSERIGIDELPFCGNGIFFYCFHILLNIRGTYVPRNEFCLLFVMRLPREDFHPVSEDPQGKL